jgi:hypothetical protein
LTTQANLKDDYLFEMGITPWYPRVHLVNALAPLDLIQNQREASPEQLTEVSAQTSNNELTSAPITDLQAEQSPIVEQVVKPIASKPATNQGSGENVRFGLGVYVVGNYIIASSLTSQHETLQDQAWRLMQNILRAIRNEDHPLAYHHSIYWPFFQNKSADQSLSSAQEYVDEFIGHLSEQYKVNKIIAFGGVLPKLKQWSPSSDTYKPEVHLVLPSLYKMLDNPAEKAKAWQLIQTSPFK